MAQSGERQVGASRNGSGKVGTEPEELSPEGLQRAGCSQDLE